ncbi:unnamed protein product [Victoria cruziana]
MEGGSEGLLKTLRWLEWQIPPHLKSLPDAICLEKMVVLDLCGSPGITQVWNHQRSTRKKVFLSKLRVLKLSGCDSLTSCPDFTIMPNLQQLDLSGCITLEELHPSIGLLKSLAHLDLSGCESLKQLPEEIYRLTSLEVLYLSGCPKITSLPLPPDVSKVHLNKLRLLNLKECDSLTSCPDFTIMPNLQQLDFTGCGRLREVHSCIGLLKSLTRLPLSGCESLEQLPGEIYQLTSLEELDLSECYKITRLPSPPEDSKVHLNKLRLLKLIGCYSLTRCPDFTIMPNLQQLDLNHCYRLRELHPSIGLLNSLTRLDLYGCHSLEQLPRQIYQLTSLEQLDLTSELKLQVYYHRRMFQRFILTN